MVVLLLVDLEPNLVVTGSYVYLLVHLLTGLENVLVKLVRSRFEMREELDHELLVVVVGPGVRHPFTVFFFEERELGLEQVEEIFEQEINVDVSAHVLGKFTHEALVRLARGSVVFVIAPVIVEIVLNLKTKLFW